MNLDADQYAAVTSAAPSTFCLAGPGAGKSRTIIERIKHLVATGTDPHTIWCMTFTVAGARELKNRLDGIQLGALSTRHSIMFRMLQRYGGRIGYREGGINLIPTDLADELLQQVAKDLRYKGSGKALTEARDPLAQLCHKEFQHRLKRNNLCTYDGVLTGALKLLTTDGEMLMPAALIIDEAQDDALVDWMITRAMQERAPDMTLFVAGDEKQSIFGFRGAYPRGFTHAAETAAVHKLQHNYRSGAAICAAATRLIGHNGGLLAAETVSVTGTEGAIDYSKYQTCADERAATAMRILRSLSSGRHLSDFAILCRTNSLCQQFRDLLQADGVPVRQQRQQQLPAGFGHALNVLSLFADLRSDILAERVLQKVDPNRVGAAKEVARRDGIWLAAAAFNGWPATTDPANLCTILPRYEVDKETCDLIASRIQPDWTLADLRHDLYDVARNGLGEQEAQSGIYCGTIHSFKGKEAPVVFLPAWEEGILPSLRADSDETEERRIAFVGITRAASVCHISSAGTRAFEWGGVKAMQPSRFVKEAGL